MKIGSIVIHCYEFERMTEFWKEALHYRYREAPSAGWAVICDPEGRCPNLSFQKRDRRKESRNWIHLDLYSADPDGEVRRLLDLGAKRYPWRYPPEADYVVLEDPDGNLFCVVFKPAP
jgi:catechol 2,3-dioxygenase-like lactoylglutathione lyase family enzyme